MATYDASGAVNIGTVYSSSVNFGRSGGTSTFSFGSTVVFTGCTVSGLAFGITTFSGLITANGGITLPTGQSLTIGGASFVAQNINSFQTSGSIVSPLFSSTATTTTGLSLDSITTGQGFSVTVSGTTGLGGNIVLTGAGSANCLSLSASNVAYGGTQLIVSSNSGISTGISIAGPNASGGIGITMLGIAAATGVNLIGIAAGGFGVSTSAAAGTCFSATVTTGTCASFTTNDSTSSGTCISLTSSNASYTGNVFQINAANSACTGISIAGINVIGGFGVNISAVAAATAINIAGVGNSGTGINIGGSGTLINCGGSTGIVGSFGATTGTALTASATGATGNGLVVLHQSTASGVTAGARVRNIAAGNGDVLYLSSASTGSAIGINLSCPTAAGGTLFAAAGNASSTGISVTGITTGTAFTTAINGGGSGIVVTSTSGTAISATTTTTGIALKVSHASTSNGTGAGASIVNTNAGAGSFGEALYIENDSTTTGPGISMLCNGAAYTGTMIFMNGAVGANGIFITGITSGNGVNCSTVATGFGFLASGITTGVGVSATTSSTGIAVQGFATAAAGKAIFGQALNATAIALGITHISTASGSTSAGAYIANTNAVGGDALFVTNSSSTGNGILISVASGAKGLSVTGSTAAAAINSGTGGVTIGTTSTTVGLTLNNNTASYVPAVLNYYETATGTLNWSGPIPTVNNVAYTITRIGNVAFFNTATVSGTGNANAVFTSTAIPARFWPANTTNASGASGLSNSLLVPISVGVSTTGVFTVKNTETTTGEFSASGTNQIDDGCWSWLIANS